MIYERSCDTEDWSNDADSALLYRNKFILKYIKIENQYKTLQLPKSSQYYWFYFSVFWSNK